MSDIQQTQNVDNFSTLFDKLDKDGAATLVAILQSRTVTKAAEVLGVDRTTMYYRMDKYGLRKIIDAIPLQAINQLRMASAHAAETLVNLTDTKDDRIKLEASKEILDRVGIGGSPDVLVQNNTNVTLPGEFEKYDTVSPVAVGSSQGPDQVPGS